MPEVDVVINGRSYRVACEVGQEERLSGLAAYIDDRVETLVSSLGQIGDTRLLVMTGLMIADELAEAYATLSEAGLAAPEQDEPRAAIEEARKSVAARIQDAAVRIEGIAEEVARVLIIARAALRGCAKPFVPGANTILLGAVPVAGRGRGTRRPPACCRPREDMHGGTAGAAPSGGFDRPAAP